MGGASPPRLVPGKVPHFLPQRNPNCTFFPTFSFRTPRDTRKSLHSAGFQGEIKPTQERAESCTRGCRAAICHATCMGAGLAHTISPVTRTLQAGLPLTLAATILAVALGGCGSSSPGTSASPATVTPASAPLYIDAVVRPEGSLKTDTSTAARTLTGRQKPFEGLLKLLGGPSGHTPNYAHEVEPWLGPHAGVFLSAVDISHAQGLLSAELLTKALSEGLTGVEASLLGQSGLLTALESSSAQGALVLDTTDVDKARSFLEAQAHDAGAHSESYRGVTYDVAPDGVAEGVVHRFAVIGSEAGLKSVIDTAAGGPALAQSAGYAKLASTAESGALANAYFSAEELASSAKTDGGDSGAGSILPLVEGVLGSPGQLYASVIPSASTVAIDLDTLPPASSASSGSSSGGSSSGESPSGHSSSEPSPASATSGAQVLRGLPGGSWLAIGVEDLGRTFGGSTQGLQTLASLGSGLSIGTISLGAPLAPLSSHTLDVQRDLLSWMGATGVYVSGSSILNLQAAVIITSKNPTRSREAVTKLARAYREAGGQTSPTSVPGTETAVAVKLPNFPLTLTMAYGQGKFVMGLGPSSIQEALSPQTTLAGSANYSTAASALGRGIEPSALVEFHTLSGLIESLGLNQDPGFSGFASGIAPLSNLAVGGGESLAGRGQAGARGARAPGAPGTAGERLGAPTPSVSMITRQGRLPSR